MHPLTPCPACIGFLPPGASRCPHCGTTVQPERLPGLSRALMGAGHCAPIALNLMACYGYPICDERDPSRSGSTELEDSPGGAGRR